ncbi:serine/threonine-protein kinase [Leptolyngbya sp. FACHB-261]|uniref:serine/threonine protein kinase n=1 Tax=Leptolyngbya sp. FACHB-261 TaxID=2692806 RepID=UPI001684276C|nr:protein kinase [Leptolyngbya sp. FACHB-261]MBD2103395.1 protein kinase [Leptolyngbya sp. FACHB-261]
MHSLTGTTLQNGKYQIEQVLGLGGFGITYRALHTYLGQTVVIKTLNAVLSSHAQVAGFQRKFLEEARRLARCFHPNIVRVSDFFEENGQSFMVMDYIPGPTLEAVVQEKGPLSEADAIHYVRQIGSALSAIHAQGMLHRDVKPQNILLHQVTQDVVLIDFGIAREFTPGVTQTQTSALSEGYAPPEQYVPQARRTPALDIYGLAATLYFLVTAKVPPPATLRTQIPLSAPSDLQPQLSPQLNHAVLRGMQLAAETRPQQVKDWLALLSPLAGVTSSVTVPVALAQPRPPSVPVSSQTPTPAAQLASQSTISQVSPQKTRVIAQLNTVPSQQTRQQSGRAVWIGLGVLSAVVLGSGLAVLSSRSPEPEPVAEAPVVTQPSVSAPVAEPEPEPSAPVEAPAAELPPAEPAQPEPPEPSPSPEATASSPPPEPSPTAEPAEPIKTTSNATGSIAPFPTGTARDQVRQALGRPSQTFRRGSWPNTTADLFEVIPNQLTLAYLYDRNTLQVRQSEASFGNGVNMEQMQSALTQMLGSTPSSSVLNALEAVKARQRKSYRFRAGGKLEGVIQRNPQGRLYIAVWEADLH